MPSSSLPLHPSFPFAAWYASPRVMPDAHAHTDLELNFFVKGSARYFLAGRFCEVPSGTLAVFWAGLPHRIVALTPGTEYLCMTLPLAWFLNWHIGDGLTARLMAGEMVTDTDGEAGTWDAHLFGRWASELTKSGGTPAARRVALLEVEARLRRLASPPGPLPEAGRGSLQHDNFFQSERFADLQKPTVLQAPPSRFGEGAGGRGRSNALQRIADHLSRHYQDPELSVKTIARALDLHPNYVQTAFKNGCGLPVWEYLTRLRVSHAQRLLLTTDWTTERIAHDCGFSSSSRFFAVFKTRCGGVTPRQYRLQS